MWVITITAFIIIGARAAQSPICCQHLSSSLAKLSQIHVKNHGSYYYHIGTNI